MHVIINDPQTGKSYKIELSEEQKQYLLGKKVGEKIDGSVFGLEGYVLEIRGGSNNAGFPMVPYVEGATLKKVLLKAGSVGFRKKRRRKKVKGHRKRGVKWNHKALRLRKTVRGNMIAEDITSVNLKVVKYGVKKIEEVLQSGGSNSS